MGLSWTAYADATPGPAIESGEKSSRHPSSAATEQQSSPDEENGRSKAFIELYQSNVEYVWRAARRLGLQPTEADDVVQETFISALRFGGSFTSRSAERAWLFALLYNVAQHHWRRRRRWAAKNEAGVDLDGLPAPTAGAPDKRAETTETVRIFEEILACLEPERRAVLILAELEERPVSEIAEILGINVNTATSRLRLARQQVETAIARRRARDGWRYK